MGDNADDIMMSFVFEPADDSEKYDKVKEKFDNHFVVKRNTIYERAKFNQRVQGADEAVESFITTLFCLVEYCEYGTLRDEMIRDRLVVGLRDAKLSERLQMDATLSLEKAVNMARQSENVHKQQEVVRGMTGSGEANSSNIDSVRVPKFKENQKQASFRDSEAAKKTACPKCGNVYHNRNVCPARDAKCYKCSREGHYARMCKSTKVNEIYYVESSDSEYDKPDIFLGEIADSKKESWEVEIVMNGELVNFKLDSGADVSVIPCGVYNAIPEPPQLEKTRKRLYGPCRYQLKCKGKFIATLHYKDKTYKEEMYVIEDLERPLLGRQACNELCVIGKIDEIQSKSDKQQYMRNQPRLFKGLGCL